MQDGRVGQKKPEQWTKRDTSRLSGSPFTFQSLFSRGLGLKRALDSLFHTEPRVLVRGKRGKRIISECRVIVFNWIIGWCRVRVPTMTMQAHHTPIFNVSIRAIEGDFIAVFGSKILYFLSLQADCECVTTFLSLFLCFRAFYIDGIVVVCWPAAAALICASRSGGNNKVRAAVRAGAQPPSTCSERRRGRRSCRKGRKWRKRWGSKAGADQKASVDCRSQVVVQGNRAKSGASCILYLLTTSW